MTTRHAGLAVTRPLRVLQDALGVEFRIGQERCAGDRPLRIAFERLRLSIGNRRGR